MNTETPPPDLMAALKDSLIRARSNRTPPAMTDAEVVEPGFRERLDALADLLEPDDPLVAFLRKLDVQPWQLALAENARLRQERNEAQAKVSELAERVWRMTNNRDANEYAAGALSELDEQNQALRAELDAERDRYTRLVGEVERIADEMSQAGWNPHPFWTRGNELRAALAATAPQTAPAQPAALPPCPVCGFADWHTAASPLIAQDLHVRDHERQSGQPTAADPEPVRVTAGEARAEPPPGDWVSAEVYWLTTESLRAERDEALKNLNLNKAGWAAEIERTKASEDFRMQVVMALCTEDDDEERTDAEVVQRVRELTLAATNESLELDRLRSAHPVGDEHLQALRGDLTEVLDLDDDATTADDASIVERVRQLVTTELEYHHVRRERDQFRADLEAIRRNGADLIEALSEAERDAAEARREAERLRGEVAKIDKGVDLIVATFAAAAAWNGSGLYSAVVNLQRQIRALAGSSDTTGGSGG